jgi:hydrogenase maturation factor
MKPAIILFILVILTTTAYLLSNATISYMIPGYIHSIIQCVKHWNNLSRNYENSLILTLFFPFPVFMGIWAIVWILFLHTREILLKMNTK